MSISQRVLTGAATVAAVLIAVCTSSSACGGILFFTDADLFAAAVSDGGLFLLGIEDFEEADIAGGGANAMDDPLDANTNNGFFSPGDILDALRIQSNLLGPDAFMEDPRGVGALFLRNASGGTTSKNVCNNHAVDSLDVITLTPTMAMSFDLITLVDVDLDNVEVDVWSEGGALLGSTITPGSGAGTFLGIVATGGDTLDRVNLFISNDLNFTWAGVDNVALYDDATCPWDLDGDGLVATSDLLTLLGAWGSDPGGPPDFDGDMNVATSDLLKLLGNWGPCPSGEPPCPSDCGPTPDGLVATADLLAMLGQWGAIGTSCDLDGGGVSTSDLLTLLGTWGPCPK